MTTKPFSISALFLLKSTFSSFIIATLRRRAVKIKVEKIMTKTDLIAAVAEKASISKAQAGEAVNATLDVIMSTVASGEAVTLPGFGTFEKRHRDERQGRNPQTGEATTIAATDIPAFKAGKGFKDAVKSA